MHPAGASRTEGQPASALNMAEIVDIPLSDLLMDGGNPRLPDEVGATQQETATTLAQQQGDNILRLAADIQKNGMDPTTLVAVVPTGDQHKRYKVIEGNRRVLALKALETPSLITPVLSTASSRKLTELSDKYSQAPIDKVPCVLFEREQDAEHWLRLRHTGQNSGVGLVEWGADEKDRFNSRHAGARKPAGQLIDFVEKRGTLSAEARTSKQKIISNVERILGSPHCRGRLGIDVVQGEVVALFPEAEIIKGLTRVVEDLKTGKVSVPDLYKKEDREAYVDKLPRTVRPKASTRLPDPVVLKDLTSGSTTPRTAPAKPRRPRGSKAPRTTVLPKGTQLEISAPRINAIYNELLTLSAESYPNSSSVLLRVFIELSVDHYLDKHKLMTEQEMRNNPLAKRLKKVAEHLEQNGKIGAKLKAAVVKVADGKSVLAPTIPTFNQYVHNQYVFPRATDLYSTWDELAPFMEQVWP